jgi:hypothetical protein
LTEKKRLAHAPAGADDNEVGAHAPRLMKDGCIGRARGKAHVSRQIGAA